MRWRFWDAIGAWMLDRDPPPLVHLGTGYGGWVVPAAVLRPGNVAVCAGAGEDVSFDVALNRAGLRVITVDPTPAAVAHVGDLLTAAAGGRTIPVNGSPTDVYDLADFDPARLTMVPVGLDAEGGVRRFYAPEVGSPSVTRGRDRGVAFEAECLSLAGLRERLGLGRIDILKLDIEGAEYGVIEELVSGDCRPPCLCVELHPFGPDGQLTVRRVIGGARALRAAGYRLVHIKRRWDCLFILG